jgi:hypothetical protein
VLEKNATLHGILVRYDVLEEPRVLLDKLLEPATTIFLRLARHIIRHLETTAELGNPLPEHALVGLVDLLHCSQ